MRRTTAGVNHFVLSTLSGKRDAETRTLSEVEGIPQNASPKTAEGSTSALESRTTNGYRSAASTLHEITADNAAFRESTEVHVKYFDIEIEEAICTMRDDTRLAIVDIPGLNEAGADAKYRAYVENKWSTFDCVVVVMDGRQGANTEEQVGL